ncbi:MAG: glycosyltransferase family 4 protein [Lachnospiraceae bacterium]|nr:glycosyltransferase family 4 protein [Lachnospiraceae bacterium]
MQTIWIIDHYSSEPKYGGISRQFDFARELGRRGYHVVIIASGFCHFTHTYIADKPVKVSTLDENVHYIYIKTSSYQENGGLGRGKNMLDFMRKVIKYEDIIARRYGKPDAVTGCSVHPLAWVAAYKASKRFQARFVAEVRDFWPRIWVVSGDKKKTDPMVLFFDTIQRWAFRRADRIIYSMYHGDKYLCGELGVPKSKAYLIGQPMDCERFDENCKRPDLLPDEIRQFIKDSFVCSFAGYYMAYEGVYVMLEALKILEAKGLPVKMVFVGSGQEKEGMERYIKDHHLHHALVWDRIPKEAVPALISRSDICMAHLEVEGHKEVYKYGVSKNKVNEYLYSGACTLYGFLYRDDEVAASGGGLMFEPYHAADLAEKIEMVYHMPESQRKQYGIRGREYIRANHSVEVLTDRMTEVLFG